MTEDQRVTDAQIRHELLEQLRQPGAQVNWAGFAAGRDYEKAQVRKVCIQMRRDSEIINAHHADDGVLASHVKKLRR